MRSQELAAREQELKLRLQELPLRKSENENNHAQAMRSIEAQEAFDQRLHQFSMDRNKKRFVFFPGVFCAGVCCFFVDGFSRPAVFADRNYHFGSYPFVCGFGRFRRRRLVFFAAQKQLIRARGGSRRAAVGDCYNPRMKAISHFRSPDAENPLAKHLREVADRARDFGAIFGASDWAECAGLLHDIGKFGEPFQKYIRESVQKERENAHIESEAPRAKSGRGRVNHSSAGALFADDAFGSSAVDSARALEFVVTGHHAGLPDEAGSASSLEQRLKQKHLLKEIADRLPSEIEASIRAFRFPSSPPSDDSIALWIRMLFSCLVDADFLATESFMDSAKSESRGGYDSILDLRERLGAHLRKKKEAAPSSPMNSLRAEICERCEKRAIEPSGLFRLTAPTGAGKTLASMTFALRHAIEHNKRRVIYAIPYTSIIEQTAKEFPRHIRRGECFGASQRDRSRRRKR